MTTSPTTPTDHYPLVGGTCTCGVHYARDGQTTTQTRAAWRRHLAKVARV